MTSRHPRVLIIGAVCALAVWSARAAQAQAPSRPCAVLTQPQIDGIVGVKVGAGEPIGDSGCQWSATPPSTRVAVSFHSGQDWATMKTPLPGVTKTAISGIGDDAFSTTVARLTTLSVKKGKVVFVLSLYGIRDPDQQITMEKSLATDLLAKL